MSDPVIDDLMRHLDYEERAAEAQWVGQVLEALTETGRFWVGCDDCFPAGAFTLEKYDDIHVGFKDQDGLFVNDLELVVTVHGHTTIYPNERSEAITECIQEMVMGTSYPGEWSGSDWTMWFAESFTIPEEGGEKPPAVLARYILMKVGAIIKSFREEMRHIDDLAEQMDQDHEHYPSDEE